MPSPPSFNLRQKNGAELYFVKLINDISSTTVTIDATAVKLGVYTLVLESIDTVNTPNMTLMTDTIKI